MLGDALSCDLPVDATTLRHQKSEEVATVRHAYQSAPPTPYIAYLRQVRFRAMVTAGGRGGRGGGGLGGARPLLDPGRLQGPGTRAAAACVPMHRRMWLP